MEQRAAPTHLTSPWPRPPELLPRGARMQPMDQAPGQPTSCGAGDMRRPASEAELGFVRRPMVRWLDPHQLLDTVGPGAGLGLLERLHRQPGAAGHGAGRGPRPVGVDRAVGRLRVRPGRRVQLHLHRRLPAGPAASWSCGRGDDATTDPAGTDPGDGRRPGVPRAQAGRSTRTASSAPTGRRCRARRRTRAADLFAIPGSHDWYDGLINFTNIFCRGRRAGGAADEPDQELLRPGPAPPLVAVGHRPAVRRLHRRGPARATSPTSPATPWSRATASSCAWPRRSTAGPRAPRCAPTATSAYLRAGGGRARRRPDRGLPQERPPLLLPVRGGGRRPPAHHRRRRRRLPPPDAPAPRAHPAPTARPASRTTGRQTRLSRRRGVEAAAEAGVPAARLQPARWPRCWAPST